MARLADIQPVDEVAVSVGLVTPTGQRRARTGSESVTIELVRDTRSRPYVSDIPLSEEGIHPIPGPASWATGRFVGRSGVVVCRLDAGSSAVTVYVD